MPIIHILSFGIYHHVFSHIISASLYICSVLSSHSRAPSSSLLIRISTSSPFTVTKGLVPSRILLSRDLNRTQGLIYVTQHKVVCIQLAQETRVGGGTGNKGNVISVRVSIHALDQKVPLTIAPKYKILQIYVIYATKT